MKSGRWKRARSRAAGRADRAIPALPLIMTALLAAGADAAAASGSRKPVPDVWGGLPQSGALQGRGSHGPALGVPLPRPRPPEAPRREASALAAPDAESEAGEAAAAKGGGGTTPRTAAEPAGSACRRQLTEDIAIAPSIPDIRGPGGCGGEDLVRLEAVVLPDKRRVAVKPAAILRCAMASAVADWVRSDLSAQAEGLGSRLAGLDNFDSYECRSRNRIAGARMSEHGRANALDVRGFQLADGRMISLTDRTVGRDLRENVLRSVCGRFSTVLGPGSDWFHEDHIHLDVAERRSNYRICQWNVWDPLPKVAPLLPAERPEDAPPREVTAKADERDGRSQPGAVEVEEKAGDPGPAAAPPAQTATTKKRRQSRRF